MIFISLSCTQKNFLSEEDKKAVENEIHQFMDSLNAAFESVTPERAFNYFLQTDELVVATQGNLITDPSALLDTMKVHMAFMKTQTGKTIAEEIFVITPEAAVISISRIVTVTFKNDSQVNMPYALTMLLVKREGKWKIAHYHN